MIRLPTRLKALFQKGGAWWHFYQKYQHIGEAQRRGCKSDVETLQKERDLTRYLHGTAYVWT